MSIAHRIPASGEVTRLAILGLLSFHAMHGYEVRREIELRQMERWADVSYGSIYGRLRRLVADGLVAVVGSEQVGNRPSRTVYEITDAGRAELARRLRAALSVPELAAQAVDLALSLCTTTMARLGARELAVLLQQRRDRLSALAVELDTARDQRVSSQPGVSALVEDLIGHTQRRIAAEQEWTEHVIARLAAGDYHTPPRGPLDAPPAADGGVGEMAGSG